MRTVAVIVSAGKSKRFKGSIPKQYIKINNKPLIYYTLSVFNSSPNIDGIVLVSDKDCRQLVRKYNFNKVFSIVKGGRTRAHSVYNGLKVVPKNAEIVVIHDGVRSLVKKELIKDVISKAKRFGAAVCAVPVKNTIKDISVDKVLIRKNLVEVQTPQAFRYNIIMNCYNRFKDRLDFVTDDSSLVEMAGHKVKIVQGDYENIKITTNEDMDYVRGRSSDIKCPRTGLGHIGLRAGIGYDIHRLAKDRRLVLGGVLIPSKYGLLGHSDADVLLHAITDAMLGAIGERDIGWHFSNKDPRYKGISSSYFLVEAKKMIQKKRYKIQNIDSIIIAQEPKLQPYYNDMVRNISKWLDIPKDSITVKFTTPEEVGPLGHKKAIASIAIVVINKERNP